MALCTSCGNQVEDSASFCTSCGKRMPAAAHPSAAVTVTRPVCSSCGAPGDPGSVFCTECGKRAGCSSDCRRICSLHRLIAATAPRRQVEDGCAINFHQIHFAHRVEAKLEPGTSFCTNCGHRQSDLPKSRISDHRCDSGASARSYAAGQHRTWHCASSQHGANKRCHRDRAGRRCT